MEKIPPGGIVVTNPGGRVNYCPAVERIAFDRRITDSGDSRADGWFNVFTADLDGQREHAVTFGTNFGWSETLGREAWRHVGLPTWSHDGQYLLLSVEEIDMSAPASTSPNVEHHVAMQPGRGTANSIALWRLEDDRRWWLWRHQQNEGKGTRPAHFTPYHPGE